ncbi:hypothetical protein FHG87_004486 [Trinorchestia longiramus]|nr:hypothetical protein FHG87_004486 [Trinorchestia longiramus]
MKGGRHGRRPTVDCGRPSLLNRPSPTFPRPNLCQALLHSKPPRLHCISATFQILCISSTLYSFRLPPCKSIDLIHCSSPIERNKILLATSSQVFGRPRKVIVSGVTEPLTGRQLDLPLHETLTLP